MITKVCKSKRVRPITTLLALTLPVALALVLGLAALALALPAWVSAQTSDANTTGKQYEGSDPQLYVSEPKAAKPDGDKQPLDLSIELTDESGNPIEGAKVRARATDFENFVDAYLTDMGDGHYSACAFGYFNGSGEGAVRIHIRADKPGYVGGAGDGSNSVGSLCLLSGPLPSE
jgi:hypothetical protein